MFSKMWIREKGEINTVDIVKIKAFKWRGNVTHSPNKANKWEDLQGIEATYNLPRHTEAEGTTITH